MKMEFITNALTQPLGKRWHLVELHEHPSCPEFIRECVQDSLAFAWKFEDGIIVKKCAAKQAAPVLIAALKLAGTDEILDLCSGGGGPYDTFAHIQELKASVKKFTLTDLYPNIDAFSRISRKHPGRVEFCEYAVDATACEYNKDTKYLRTMCASMHHMPETLLEGILADCVLKKNAFCAMEITTRSVGSMAYLPIGAPLLALLSWFCMFPAMKSWEHALKSFVLTFIIPIIPFIFMFDGFVSCLRTYTKQEFLQVARKADPNDEFDWTVTSRILDGLHIPLVSYIGIPKSASKQ